MHVDMAGRAAALGADMLVFSELSITGYEPGLARQLAMDASDAVLDPIRSASKSLPLVISVGLPLMSSGLPRIGMATFYPDGEVQLYAKQKLHGDELPFFSGGTTQAVLEARGCKVVPGICYETRFEEPFEQASRLGAEVYVASAAKPSENIQSAHEHYSRAARQHSIVTALSNCVGQADSFVAVGCSAAWGRNGKLLGALDEHSTGLLLVDTAAEMAEVIDHP